MSSFRFRAVKSHVNRAKDFNLLADETHYNLFVEGYPYSIGHLKQCEDGRWLTYGGGRREIDFSDLDHIASYPTAADALAAFRSRYEAAEAKAAAIRADAFAKIVGYIPPVERDPRLTEEEFDDITIRVKLHHGDRSLPGSIGMIEFECSVPEAFAFLECPDTNVSIEGFRFTSNGKRLDSYTKWFIPVGDVNYHLRGIGRSLSGRGRQQLAAA